MGRLPEESIPARLARLAAEDPDRILIEEVDGPSITRAGFLAAALKVADALVSLGVKPGDCVVTIYDNCIRAQAVWLGICWTGAMEVPINPDFRGNSLVYALNDCRASVVLTSAPNLAQLEAVRDACPLVRHILTIDDAARSPVLDNRPLAEVEAAAPKVEHSTPEITDPYAVIYTSGTTGASKGVMTPWGSLQFAQINQLYKGDDWADPDPTFYSPWPCFHSSGRTGLTFAIERGGRMVMRPKLSTTRLLDDIRAYRCTHAHLLGVAGWLMAQPPRPDDADTPLRYVLMNPVIEDFKAFEERFGVKVSTGWGMTEIGFPMAAGNLADFRTCGQMDEAYEAKIVDDEGNELPDGEAGELLIRSRYRWLFFNAYLNKPEATAACWDEDGWYRTGDILRRDAQGFYYFLDRKSDYMRVNGNNVSSVEVESEARVFPGVADAAAVAISAAEVRAAGRESSAGEDEIRLMVQVADGASVDPAALAAHLAGHMPRYMLPRFVEFVSDFPRTPTGKIQKKELRPRPLPADAWENPALRRTAQPIG